MIDPLVSAQLSGRAKMQEWLTLEQTPTLIDGGGADTGGPNQLPHGTVTWTPANVTGAASLQFKPKTRPKGQPWDNAYNYQKLTQAAICTYFSLGFQFVLPTQADIAAATAVEWEVELCEAGIAYNMAWQYLVAKAAGGPQWRLFNQTVTPKRWDSVAGLPLPNPQPGALVSAIALFSVNRQSRTTTHESIEIDGQTYVVGQTHSAIQKWSSQTNYLHYALQPDSDGRGSPFGIKVKSWNVRGL